MPLPTLLAAAEHAEISGPTGTEDPSDDLAALAGAGIDLDDVTALLLEQGIDTFVQSMTKLVEGIDAKREAIVTGRPPTISASIPSAYEAAIAERVKRVTEDDVAQRVWRRDESLWGGPGVPEIGNR